MLNRTRKRVSFIHLLLMVDFKNQLSPLEGYSLILCDVTSHIKADKLPVSVKFQIGILHTPSSCLGLARKRFE